MVEMRSQLAIERAGLVTLHLQLARRSSIPTWTVRILCAAHLLFLLVSVDSWHTAHLENSMLLEHRAVESFATAQHSADMREAVEDGHKPLGRKPRPGLVEAIVGKVGVML